MLARTMKITGVALLVFCVALVRVSVGKPIDAEAAEHYAGLTQLISRPLEKRKLSFDEVKAYTTMARADNRDMQVCGALALAFAQDDASLSLLRALSKTSDPLLSGASSYAVIVRESFGRGESNFLSNLSFWLGRSENPFARMFLANRIAVDFGDKAMYTLLSATRAEAEATAKSDMLYYIAKGADKSILTEVLRWKWNEEVPYPENVAFIMASITPDRPKDEMSNSCRELLQGIRAKVTGKVTVHGSKGMTGENGGLSR